MRQFAQTLIRVAALSAVLGCFMPAIFAQAEIDIVKNAIGGPHNAGDNIDFEITLTNTGTIAFDVVEVLDSKAPDCYRFLTDFGGSPTLDPGATFVYTCTVFNALKDFSNIATAKGYVRDPGGCLIRKETMKSNTFNLDLRNGSILVDKHALDGTDQQTLLSGGTAEFEIVVTNDGDVPLTDVEVKDQLAKDCEVSIGDLAPGESYTYTCSEPNVFSAFTNRAVARGNSEFTCPNRVRDNDTSEVFVTDPQCNLSVTKTADPTVIIPGPSPGCDTNGDPTELIFRYTGNDCSATNNTQEGKVECSGVPGPGTVIVEVLADTKKTSANPTSVAPGDLLTLGNAFAADTRLQVGDQTLKFHTSCSKPLNVGDVFGSLELVSFNGQSGGSNEVTYTYLIENGGDDVDNISLVDDKLGIITSGLFLAAGQSQQFTRSTILTQTTTNTATVTGDLVFTGERCTAQDSATVTVEDPPGPPFSCTKPIDSLTMIWDGAGPIRIKAWKGNVGSTLLADIDNINPWDEVTVSGFAGSPNDVIWELFDAGTANKIGESDFHLSCSDPDMNGPEDCGKLEGDAKGQAGFINLWRLEGMIDAVSTLNCTP